MRRLKVVFMGSPAFAVPCLDVLLETCEVLAVVCQPDKPAGRGLELQPPAIKLRAIEAGVRVLQPTSVRKAPFLDELKAIAPALVVVVAYGKILPPEVLALPPLGCVNVHASLLPRYRGAAPIQWSIIRGERETGVTLMRMDEGMDTGDILVTRSQPIPETVTAGEMHESLSRLGAELLRENLSRIFEGKLIRQKQDAALATLAPMLTKETGRVDFTVPARAVADLIRGCDPWPNAYTVLGEDTLKLFQARVVERNGAPGAVLGLDGNALVVACGEGAVAIGELQLPGRKRMSAQALLAGRAIAPGTRLGA